MKSVTVGNLKSIPSRANFKSRQEWEGSIWKNLSKIPDLLENLLTDREKKQIVKRAIAISLIQKGKKYREIGEMLWLSPTTISSIRKSMQASKGYLSRNSWWKIRPRQKKRFSTFSKESSEIVYRPYGKLFYHVKRK